MESGEVYVVVELPDGYVQCSIRYGGGAAQGSIPTVVMGFSETTNDFTSACASFFQRWEQDIVMNQLIGAHVDQYEFISATERTVLPGAEVGTGGTEDQPISIALLVRKITAPRGRRFQGRLYLPKALNDTEVSPGGAILGNTVTAFQGVFDTFLGHLQDDGIPPVVLHSHKKGNPPSGVAPTIVTSFAVEAIAATQRRRMRR